MGIEAHAFAHYIRYVMLCYVKSSSSSGVKVCHTYDVIRYNEII